MATPKTPIKTLLPVGRCNNCMWYYHEDDEDINECPHCKTDAYLMDMPEIVHCVNNHERLVEALRGLISEFYSNQLGGIHFVKKAEQALKHESEGE